ncbi:uncharacterized protein BP5553_10041 [Venustampulla echinocandica]|uniref:Rhodopsin domain-containing protein n=1 Tax=Venustampulla echinocandica TaxID=2656787 RepID=A0A370TA49_9HELO|nr:uncharacterized protein BP5553_10041 [Venustampulla echinocandica]RDL30696.1 hypothetical protein BP5553_10041 [Venustampulla echinocandica]
MLHARSTTGTVGGAVAQVSNYQFYAGVEERASMERLVSLSDEPTPLPSPPFKSLPGSVITTWAMEGPPPAPGFGQPDVNHNVAINSAVAVTTCVALLAVGVRMWVRISMVRSVGWDDYWILAAMALSFSGWMVTIPSVTYGAGRHTFYILQAVGPEKMKTGLKLNFAAQIIYVFAIAAIKVSIGLFLLRFTSSKAYKILIYSILGFLAFYTIAGTASLMAQCTPFDAHFDFTIPGAVCYPVKVSQALAYTNAACGIFTDVVFALLPIPLLWKLQINRRVKTSIVGILSLGIFAATASVVKTYYVTSYGKFGDFLWDSTYLTIWMTTECNVGILAASIPAMKPLFKVVLGSTYGTGYLGGPNSRYNKGYAQHASTGRNTEGDGGFNFELRENQNSTAITTQERRGRDKFDPDNISEDSILPLQSNSTLDQKGIMKTTQVFIQTDDTKPRSIEDRV